MSSANYGGSIYLDHVTNLMMKNIIADTSSANYGGSIAFYSHCAHIMVQNVSMSYGNADYGTYFL